MRNGDTDLEASRLLAALPERQRKLLLRGLAVRPLEARQVLHTQGQPIEDLYFPMKGCLVSLSLDLKDEKSLTAALVGHEGMVGVEALFGKFAGQFTATVLAGGDSFSMKAEIWREALRDDGPMLDLCQRYLHFLLFSVSQVAGCNRFHCLEAHFCSLLLRLQDRCGRDHFEITHELFAKLIGVRRVGITQVARKLRRDGLIRYRWGKIVILDRAGLEARACVCHRQIRLACEQFLEEPRKL